MCYTCVYCFLVLYHECKMLNITREQKYFFSPDQGLAHCYTPELRSLEYLGHLVGLQSLEKRVQVIWDYSQSATVSCISSSITSFCNIALSQGGPRSCSHWMTPNLLSLATKKMYPCSRQTSVLQLLYRQSKSPWLMCLPSVPPPTPCPHLHSDRCCN